jgi:hypothetical protein
LCTVQADPAVGHTLDDLVAFLVHHPGLVGSDPQPVTTGGLPGQMLDADVAPTWTGRWPDRNGAPGVPLFGDLYGWSFRP